MGNMGYVRFTNTLGDLEDCYRHMDDQELSEAEEKSRRELIKLCQKVVWDYGDEVE